MHVSNIKFEIDFICVNMFFLFLFDVLWKANKPKDTKAKTPAKSDGGGGGKQKKKVIWHLNFIYLFQSARC